MDHTLDNCAYSYSGRTQSFQHSSRKGISPLGYCIYVSYKKGPCKSNWLEGKISLKKKYYYLFCLMLGVPSSPTHSLLTLFLLLRVPDPSSTSGWPFSHTMMWNIMKWGMFRVASQQVCVTTDYIFVPSKLELFFPLS